MYFLNILKVLRGTATQSLKIRHAKNDLLSLPFFFPTNSSSFLPGKKMYNNSNPLKRWLVTPKVLNGLHLASRMNNRVLQKQSGTEMADAMRCHFPVINHDIVNYYFFAMF